MYHSGLFSHGTKLMLSAGASGSGAIFSFHQEFWAEVVYGQRLWLFAPIAKPFSFNPANTSLSYFLTHYYQSEPRPRLCLQRPGELVYVPEGTYFAFINIGETLAVQGSAPKPVSGGLVSYVFECYVALITNDLNRAMVCFADVLEIAPLSAHVAFMLGETLLKLGHLDKAVRMLERATRLNPLGRKTSQSLAFVQVLVECAANIQDCGKSDVM